MPGQDQPRGCSCVTGRGEVELGGSKQIPLSPLFHRWLHYPPGPFPNHKGRQFCPVSPGRTQPRGSVDFHDGRNPPPSSSPVRWHRRALQGDAGRSMGSLIRVPMGSHSALKLLSVSLDAGGLISLPNCQR